MTKAHRMYLYGMLTTGAVAVVVAGLTIAVMSSRHGGAPAATDPLSVVRNPQNPTWDRLPAPKHILGDVPVVNKNLVDGWVKSVDAHSIVLVTADGDRTIHVTGSTHINVLNAGAIDPTKATPVDAASIPLDALAHVTLIEDAFDTAADIVIVKNHD